MDHFPYSHVMNTTKREELEKAYKKEKDPRVAARMLAVYMVYVRKQSISETTANLMRSDRWMHTWLTRFDAEGLDGLRDLLRLGRPRAILQEMISRIIGEMIPHAQALPT